MSRIESVEQLHALYGQPGEASLVKVAHRVTPEYRAMIQASPFAALATCGPEGLDCSPRGDQPGFVRILDPDTLAMPDRRGNNRVDSLANIVRDPRVALMFLLPGSGTTLRVNGTAHLDTTPGLLESFAVDEKPPRCAIVIAVGEIYFQCARAIVRSRLWDPQHHIPDGVLPTPGRVLASMTAGRVGGEAYDREWPGRAAATMW